LTFGYGFTNGKRAFAPGVIPESVTNLIASGVPNVK